MGSSPFKERIERGASSGIFTGDNCGADDWKDVLELKDKLVKCRTISLAHNKFEKPIPKELLAFPCFTSTLKVLDLSKNKIASIDAFSGSANETLSSVRTKRGEFPRFAIETLNLSGNAIAKLPHLFLLCMPKLKELNLSDNQIANPPADSDSRDYWLSVLSFGESLVSLNLSNNSISALPLVGLQDGLMTCEKLQTLNVSNNVISLASHSGHSLSHLRSLDLSSQRGPGLTRVCPSLFTGPKLVDVSLEGNKKKEEMITYLRTTAEYADWVKRRAGTVDRQLAAGVDARLAD